jgi:IS5 family transposase
MKSDGHLSRNYLMRRHGDQANPALNAAGDNFRLVLKWLRALLAEILTAILAALTPKPALNPAS